MSPNIQQNLNEIYDITCSLDEVITSLTHINPTSPLVQHLVGAQNVILDRINKLANEYEVASPITVGGSMNIFEGAISQLNKKKQELRSE